MRPAGAPGGLGFGLFVVAIGKLVTSDDDYFYRSAAALIYVTRAALVLGAGAADGRTVPSGSERPGGADGRHGPRGGGGRGRFRRARRGARVLHQQAGDVAGADELPDPVGAVRRVDRRRDPTGGQGAVGTADRDLGLELHRAGDGRARAGGSVRLGLGERTCGPGS